MSLIPCDRCKERDLHRKLTQVTWAWLNGNGERVAWRQRLCLTCVSTQVAPLYVASSGETLTCPGCGIDTSDDLDPIYATFYPEGMGAMHIEAPTCPSCAVRIRLDAETGGRKLENRPLSESRGQEPGPSTLVDTWAALGIVPRAS